MSIAEEYSFASSGVGSLDVDLSCLIENIINFMHQTIPIWVSESKVGDNISEGDLNSSLCDTLDSEARDKLPLIRFHHEDPAGKQRRLDLGAKPVKQIFASKHSYSRHDTILPIEGKRLPAPKKEREREYVSGVEAKKTTGGMQRFKTGDNGRTHSHAVLVAYIQENNFHHWEKQVNSWIDEFVINPPPTGETWDVSEKLTTQTSAPQITKLTSILLRNENCLTKQLNLTHLWVMLPPPSTS